MISSSLLTTTASPPRYLAMAVALLGLSINSAAQAATINVDDNCSLINAIHSANDDIAIGGCTAGSGADRIDLPADSTITLNTAIAAGSNEDGNTGLPAVNTEIVIFGGDSTIERDPSAPNFRLFRVIPGGNLTLRHLTLQGGNLPSGFGGGVDSSGASLALREVTVRDNVAFNGGGVVFFDGDLTIRLSSFINNRSTNRGGGLYTNTAINGSETATINDSTFSGNVADVSGGGIYNADGQLNLDYVTITDNHAGTEGGGVFSFGDTVTDTSVTRSIISGNRGGDVATNSATASNGFTDQGNNLVGDGDGIAAFDPMNNIISTNPKLRPLFDNGGAGSASLTHMPEIDSPAVDHLTDCGPDLIPFDQRFRVRPENGTGTGSSMLCDIGAVERDNTIVVDNGATLVDNTDNLCSLREAIDNANDVDNVGLIHNDCLPGTTSGRDIVALPPNGVFSFVDPLVVNANDALPVIFREITIEGYGSVIERDQASSEDFRLIQVATDGQLTLERSTIRGGQSTGDGGGILNDGDLRLWQTTVSGNSASFGGGIINFGNLRVEQSTVSDNSASGQGGGITSASNATIVLVQSTVSGNSALDFGGILAINNFRSVQSVISGNSDSFGSSDVETGLSGFSSQGNNLIGVSNRAFSESGDVTIGATDPGLGPLRFNGGFTRSMKPRPDSPALDSFVGSCDNTGDQRGAPDEQDGDGMNGDVCDKGAVEVGNPNLDSDMDGLNNSFDGEQDVASNACLDEGQTLPDQTVPTNTLVQCGDALMISVGDPTSGAVTVSSDGELQLFAPEVSVPLGNTLTVQAGAVFSVESVNPSAP